MAKDRLLLMVYWYLVAQCIAAWAVTEGPVQLKELSFHE